jgi:hypothetical protein
MHNSIKSHSLPIQTQRVTNQAEEKRAMKDGVVQGASLTQSQPKVILTKNLQNDQDQDLINQSLKKIKRMIPDKEKMMTENERELQGELLVKMREGVNHLREMGITSLTGMIDISLEDTEYNTRQ